MRFPLQQVFSVIVDILWDKEDVYFPGSIEENKLGRLYFFYKELEGLALSNKNHGIHLCHTGIRQTVMLSLQGLEPILNGKKHIIYFPQGGVNYFIDKLIADGLSHYLFMLKSSDFESWYNIMKAWVIPSSERDSRSNAILEAFFIGLVNFCNHSIFTENMQKALFNVGHDAHAAATQNLIKAKLSLTSLQQLFKCTHCLTC